MTYGVMVARLVLIQLVKIQLLVGHHKTVSIKNKIIFIYKK